MDNVVLVKKKSTFWKVVKVLLVVAAITFVLAKLYRKFAQKVADELEMPDEELLLEDADGELAIVEDVAEDDAFEVPADAVIANLDDME